MSVYNFSWDRYDLYCYDKKSFVASGYSLTNTTISNDQDFIKMNVDYVVEEKYLNKSVEIPASIKKELYMSNGNQRHSAKKINQLAKEMENYWCQKILLNQRKNDYPDELPPGVRYPEGAKKTVTVNAYERNPEARQKCLDHFGYQCAACEVLLKNKYGEIAENFIHVHHKKPLSDINKEYEVDPINDLIPVCPNCHAMLHKKEPPFSIDELKSIIRHHQ